MRSDDGILLVELPAGLIDGESVSHHKRLFGLVIVDSQLDLVPIGYQPFQVDERAEKRDAFCPRRTRSSAQATHRRVAS